MNGWFGTSSDDSQSIPVWTIEVDVLIQRPPTPENTRTATVMIAHPCDTWDDQWHAQLIATQMVWATFKHLQMPMASRVICVEI